MFTKISKEQKQQLNEIMQLMTDNLDISETLFLKAKEHYEAIGKWLSDDDLFKKFGIDIYTQGSFSLGTVIRPVSNEDDYDIDLVCELNINKNSIKPSQLKQLIGDRLKDNKRYKEMPADEGSRCWKIEYSDSEKFHIDILPSISVKDTTILEKMGVEYDLTQFSIYFTDKNKPNEWLISNPKGYMKWFQRKMKEIYKRRKQLLMEKFAYADIEDVPDYSVKTPLQRAIQILKRHRDIMFIDENENKPSSISITTLAAMSYQNEDNIYDTLESIIYQIRSSRILDKHQIEILNPVNGEENFADKMNDDVDKKEAFKKWIDNVDELLELIPETKGLDKVAEKLSESFGETIVKKAYDNYGQKYKELENSNKLFIKTKTGILSTEQQNSRKVKKHTFYAD